jgi:hypothetical protein
VTLSFVTDVTWVAMPVNTDSVDVDSHATRNATIGTERSRGISRLVIDVKRESVKWNRAANVTARSVLSEIMNAVEPDT